MTGLHLQGTELRYGLDMACLLLHQQAVRSVRLSTDDADLVFAAALRLGWLPGRLYVNTADLAQHIAALPGVRTAAADVTRPSADAALVLFPDLQTPPPPADVVVVVSFNALSYKSILYPGTVRTNVFQILRWLRPTHRIEQRMGMLTPQYLIPWGISLLAGARFPSLHFRCGQQALDHLFAVGVSWWIGYITIIRAARR